jgi:hypothetical protein
LLWLVFFFFFFYTSCMLKGAYAVYKISLIIYQNKNKNAAVSVVHSFEV